MFEWLFTPIQVDLLKFEAHELINDQGNETLNGWKPSGPDSAQLQTCLYLRSLSSAWRVPILTAVCSSHHGSAQVLEYFSGLSELKPSELGALLYASIKGNNLPCFNMARRLGGSIPANKLVYYFLTTIQYDAPDILDVLLKVGHTRGGVAPTLTQLIQLKPEPMPLLMQSLF